VTANLEVSPILAKTHAKLASLNDLLLEHHVVDWLESVQILLGSLARQAKDAVCLLTVEVLGLCVDAAKCVLEHIDPEVEILSEIDAVFGDKTFIATALGIPLVEPTPVLRSALAINFVAVVQLETF